MLENGGLLGDEAGEPQAGPDAIAVAREVEPDVDEGGRGVGEEKREVEPRYVYVLQLE